MQHISETSSLFDSDKFQSFDEKKEGDKQVLEAVKLATKFVSLVYNGTQDCFDAFVEYFSKTNFLVRNYILTALIPILKAYQTAAVIDVCRYIIGQTVKCGEKYDMNLEQLSELCLLLSSCDLAASIEEEVHSNILKIVEMLKEKGGDTLIKNIDVIKKNVM